MAGIVRHGAYIPYHRLGAGTAGWQGKKERAVAAYDEDALTMGVAAARDCLEGIGRGEVDALYFASTTTPYAEKQAAATLAAALHLNRATFTSDVTGSLRSATVALQSALDRVAVGHSRLALVVASDLRVGQPGSEFETEFGHAAAAVLVGNRDAMAEVSHTVSVTDEIHDVWRPAGEPFAGSWEDRFVVQAGYGRVLPEVFALLWKEAKLTPENVSRAIFYGPTASAHQDMGKKLGFQPAQVADPYMNQVGHTGCAQALLALVGALEQAKPGEHLALAGYGSGADALLLVTTPLISKRPAGRGVGGYLASKRILEDYQISLRWRGLAPLKGGGRRPGIRQPSAAAIWRERAENLQFEGIRCVACGTPQYPKQRVCSICHAKDESEPYSFADKKARLFTYSMDYMTPHPALPQVFGVIDFEGGGRMIIPITDQSGEQLHIGMDLEMTLRKIHYAGNIHSYAWKATPVRQSVASPATKEALG